jgi:hypothetical protein
MRGGTPARRSDGYHAPPERGWRWAPNPLLPRNSRSPCGALGAGEGTQEGPQNAGARPSRLRLRRPTSEQWKALREASARRYAAQERAAAVGDRVSRRSTRQMPPDSSRWWFGERAAWACVRGGNSSGNENRLLRKVQAGGRFSPLIRGQLPLPSALTHQSHAFRRRPLP